MFVGVTFWLLKLTIILLIYTFHFLLRVRIILFRSFIKYGRGCEWVFFIDEFWFELDGIIQTCGFFIWDYTNFYFLARGAPTLFLCLLSLKDLHRRAIYVKVNHFGKLLDFGHFTQRVAIKLDWVNNLLLEKAATSTKVVPFQHGILADQARWRS